MDLRAVLAPQPLGRQLDRRQRVLDFVGDAPGDVAPGGAALGGDQPGNVVERQHQAALGRAGGPHPEPQRLPRAHQVQFLFGFASGARDRGRHALQFRRHVGQEQAVRVADQPQQGVGLLVRGRDPTQGVQAQHAGAHPGQHGLDELAPGLRLDAGGSQRRLLGLKITRHLIECMR